MKKILYIFFSFVLILGISVQAQNFATKGTIEAGGSISFTSTTPVYNGTTGDASSVFGFMPYAGYFISDGFELGVNPLGIQVYSPHSGNSQTQFILMLAPSYNFNMHSNAFPFIEALLGYTSISSGGNSASGFSYGGRGGVKLAVNKGALVNLALSYILYSYNPQGANNRYGYNELMISAGFTVFWGK